MSLVDAYRIPTPATPSGVSSRARASMRDAVMAMRAVLEADDGLGFKQYYDLSQQLARLPQEPSDDVMFCFSDVSQSGSLSCPEDREELKEAVNGLVLNYQDWKSKEALVAECDRRLGALASKKRSVRSSQRSCRSQLEVEVADVRGFVKYCVSLCDHENGLTSVYKAAKQIDEMLENVRALEDLPRLKLDRKAEGPLSIARVLRAREPDIKAALYNMRESKAVNAKILSRLDDAVSAYDSLRPVLKGLDRFSSTGSAYRGEPAEAYLRSRCESVELSKQLRELQASRKELSVSRDVSLQQVDLCSKTIDAFKDKMSRQAILDYERVGKDEFMIAAFDVGYRPLGFIKMGLDSVAGRGRTDINFSFNLAHDVPICMKHPPGVVIEGMDSPESYLEGNVLYLAGASKDVGYRINLRMPVQFRDHK